MPHRVWLELEAPNKIKMFSIDKSVRSKERKKFTNDNRIFFYAIFWYFYRE